VRVRVSFIGDFTSKPAHAGRNPLVKPIRYVKPLPRKYRMLVLRHKRQNFRLLKHTMNA
jgi:hypothetical protein